MGYVNCIVFPAFSCPGPPSIIGRFTGEKFNTTMVPTRRGTPNFC